MAVKILKESAMLKLRAGEPHRYRAAELKELALLVSGVSLGVKDAIKTANAIAENAVDDGLSKAQVERLKRSALAGIHCLETDIKSLQEMITIADELLTNAEV